VSNMRRVTGFHAIEELVRAGQQGARLLVAGKGPRIKQILEQCAKAGCITVTATQAELDRIASDNRGIVLEFPEQENADIKVDFDEWLSKFEGSKALVLVLDHLSDPHNFGAILRSADQFGIDLVIMPERRSVKDTETVARSSAGANAWVKVAVVSNLVRALEGLKKAGFWIYAADMGGTKASKLDLGGKTVLVLGSEGSGVGRLVKTSCDGTVAIPSQGRVDSLNVSVAAGILMYEARRQSGDV